MTNVALLNGGKNDGLFNKLHWINWISSCEKKKIQTLHYTQNSFQIHLNLILSGKTIKLVKDNIGEYFHNFKTGKDFLNGI